MNRAVLAGTGAALAGVALVGVITQWGTDMGAMTDGGVTALAPHDPAAAPGAEVLGVERPGAASRSGARVPNVDDGWVRRTAKATQIPARAVSAYGSAVLNAPDGCAIGWTTLAGIGWVESQHGTIGDRILRPDGTSSEPILGPALDGVDFAAIPATPESAALHGNPKWDHALGPLQFIPSTWHRWARDGDGDGVSDPHDLDDAAAAAAAYLCHDQHDLKTSAGWNAAVFSYNHDNGYVVAVHAAADRYGRATR